MLKQLFSLTAIGLTFVAFLPYIRSIRRGTTKPHVFSWVIWGLSTIIVFFAQLAGNAGIGAWPIGVSGVISMYIAWLAYRRRADTDITRSDWLFFLAALSALPFWYLTSDPLWAVIILTVVDVAGFGPTIRRAWVRPQEEQLMFFALVTIRNFLVLLALEHYSLTTVLFPAAVGLACVVLIGAIAWRRSVLGREPAG